LDVLNQAPLAQPTPRDGPFNLTRLAKEFSAAEDRLKQTERRTKLHPDAVINELRYAACHLLRAQCPDVNLEPQPDENEHHAVPQPGDDPAETEIRRAIDHCRRGRYDAIEYDTLVYLERMNLFKKDYRFVLGEEIAGLPAALQTARKAQDLVEDGHDSAKHKRREQGLDELDQTCSTLITAYKNLDALRPILNSRRWKSILVLVIAGAAALGTCVGASVALANRYSSRNTPPTQSTYVAPRQVTSPSAPIVPTVPVAPGK
jgi:hypothetical protein